MSFQMEALLAFVAVGDDGDEGIVAFFNDDMWIPLVTSYGDTERTGKMMQMARAICDETQCTIRVLRFDNRQQVDTMVPDPAKAMPVCDSCGAKAQREDDHLVTEHIPGCAWMAGREHVEENNG